MLIGYARVSKDDQHPELQHDELNKSGCEKLFTDIITGAAAERPSLTRVLEELRPGDTLVVWRLDRLGRSLPHLIELMTNLNDRGVGFKSLTEQIDTTTSGGKLIFHIFGALAEFERNLIRERTMAGLAAARARGKFGGRPKSLSPTKAEMARQLYNDKRNTTAEICKELGISRTTLWRYVKGSKKDTAADDGVREATSL
jgi:DNA invertase Pin-like site-specific DNA recombinase